MSEGRYVDSAAEAGRHSPGREGFSLQHTDAGGQRARTPEAAAVCGHHSDFAVLSSADPAVLHAAVGEGQPLQTESEQMAENLKLALYGISLGRYTVDVSQKPFPRFANGIWPVLAARTQRPFQHDTESHVRTKYDSTALQRVAFTKAFSPPREEPSSVGLSARRSAPTSHMDMQLDGAAIASNRRPPWRSSHRGTNELQDTESIGENQGRLVRKKEAAKNEEESISGCGGGIDGPRLNLPDLYGLQRDMEERRRKLKQRKADHRRLERDEEMKMRESIVMVQDAIQKMISDFNALDDDLDCIASSRASSSCAQIWTNENRADSASKNDWQRGKDIVEHDDVDGQKEAPGSADVRISNASPSVNKRTETSHMDVERDMIPSNRPHSDSIHQQRRQSTIEEGGCEGDKSRLPIPPVEVRLGSLRSDDSVSSLDFDQSCNPESRQFWKRNREQREQQTRQRDREADVARQSAALVDQPHAVYITYEDSDSQGRKAFVGQTVDGKRSGKGVLTWKDGSKYAGEWHNDKSNGFGREQYLNGSYYNGAFRNDARHGFGEFAVSPEISYAGTWEDGQMHGVVYIIESKGGGQVKLIPARAERGEVHRKPYDPLSSIASVKQQVEVSVAFAKHASSAARDVAWQLSLNATKLAKHVIASRSPSPYLGLDNTAKSPILSIPEDSIDLHPPSVGAKLSQEGTRGGAKFSKQRPVSAGGSPMMRAGLPPLPRTPNSNPKQRPVTANPMSKAAQYARKEPSPSGRDIECTHLKLGGNGMQLRLAEDGLASGNASPAPSATDTLQSLYSTVTHHTDTRESDLKDDTTPVSGAQKSLRMSGLGCTDTSCVFNAQEDSVKGISEQDFEAAIEMLLSQDMVVPNDIEKAYGGRSASSPSPDELVAILLGERSPRTLGCLGGSHAVDVADSGLENASEWNSALLMGNYDLVRASRPHVTGKVSHGLLLPDSVSLQSIPGAMHKVPSQSRVPWQSSQLFPSPRPGSPFPHLAASCPAISNFGLTPRSMRLRPLPRAMRSYSPPGSTFENGSDLFSSCSLELQVGAHAASNGRVDQPHANNSNSKLLTTSGQRALDLRIQRSPEFAHPANQDRMLVAVVTAVAAEVVARLCDNVVKNADALTRASSVIDTLARQSNPSLWRPSAEGNTKGAHVVEAKVTCCSSAEGPVSCINTAVDEDLEIDGNGTDERTETVEQVCGDKVAAQHQILPCTKMSNPPANVCENEGGGTSAMNFELGEAVETRDLASSDTPPLDIDGASSLNEGKRVSKGWQIGGPPDASFTVLTAKGENQNGRTSSRGIEKETQVSRPCSASTSIPRSGVYPTKSLEAMDREVGVIADEDDEVNEACDAVHDLWRCDSPQDSIQKKVECTALPSPKELAGRLVAKYRTGFGLTADELAAFELTFRDEPRLTCFVGFINTMQDEQWLQVQNRFVDDAARAHGVGMEAQTFVREEAFAWVLEKHAHNPVNKDCMTRCGFNVPIQTLVSASYEVVTGIRTGKTFAPTLKGGHDILALRLLILHSFVETCWRAWRAMMFNVSRAEDALSSKKLPVAARKHFTPKTPPLSHSLLPWAQSEETGTTSSAHGQYISPLAKRVRPGSSKATFGPVRVLSGGRERKGDPDAGLERQRPFSARMPIPSPKTNHIDHLLRFVRQEFARSVFSNVAEAFVWFDLDGKECLSASEMDLGLKSLGILGIDIRAIFSIFDDERITQNCEALDKIQFARLFQWNNQLSLSGMRLFIHGECFDVVSNRARENQKRILEKVKVNQRARPHFTGRALSEDPNDRVGRSQLRGAGSPFTARPPISATSVLQAACSFCKQSHDLDFSSAHASGVVSAREISPVKSCLPLGQRSSIGPGVGVGNLGKASMNAGYIGRMAGRGLSQDANLLEDEIEQGYREFTPQAILSVMITAVVDVDLLGRIMGPRVSY